MSNQRQQDVKRLVMVCNFDMQLSTTLYPGNKYFRREGDI